MKFLCTYFKEMLAVWGAGLRCFIYKYTYKLYLYVKLGSDFLIYKYKYVLVCEA